LRVAGFEAPPMGGTTPGQDEEIVARVNRASPDIVWVGLGCPKQELWMAAMRSRLTAPVLIGVGAAFDFHTGRVAQAPRWMMRAGLEWLFRLSREPRRLWHRYLVYNPQFVMLTLLQLAGLRGRAAPPAVGRPR
jgi:N-acetylglucosaminyldiphosphoundecaprenol N-acetyl-beta-D-mannosaminyltransferase